MRNNLLNIFLYVRLFLKERKHTCGRGRGGGQRIRGELCADSFGTDNGGPHAGLGHMNHEIMTCTEVGRSTERATQAPLNILFYDLWRVFECATLSRTHQLRRASQEDTEHKLHVHCTAGFRFLIPRRKKNLPDLPRTISKSISFIYTCYCSHVLGSQRTCLSKSKESWRHGRLAGRSALRLGERWGSRPCSADAGCHLFLTFML